VSTRSDGSKSPPSPPPPPSPTFRFTPPPSDLVLYGGDLLEILGDLNLLRHLSFLSARSCPSGGRRDPLRQLMFGGHQIWGFIPVRSLIDPTFGVDYLKLFLKSPHHARITWHLLPWQTRFDLVVYLTGITAPDLLLLRILVVVVVLVLFRTMVKCCVDGCICCCTVCVCCCWCCCSCNCNSSCSIVVVAVMLFCFAALLVGSFALLVGHFAVTYVTFPALYVGFYLPLCRVV
jgi:hypothetical protein